MQRTGPALTLRHGVHVSAVHNSPHSLQSFASLAAFVLAWHMTAAHLLFKVTGYSCARRAKCIGKCILKLANQKSRVRRE